VSQLAGNEQRQINRDSLFMLAGLRVDGRDPVRRASKSAICRAAV
jgi:hypothetical protein